MPANDLPAAIAGDVEGGVVQAVEKTLLDERIVIGGAHMLGQRLFDARAVGVIVELLAGNADDARFGRELAIAIAMVERRHQLAHGEIAGAAIYDEIER